LKGSATDAVTVARRASNNGDEALGASEVSVVTLTVINGQRTGGRWGKASWTSESVSTLAVVNTQRAGLGGNKAAWTQEITVALAVVRALGTRVLSERIGWTYKAVIVAFAVCKVQRAIIYWVEAFRTCVTAVVAGAVILGFGTEFDWNGACRTDEAIVVAQDLVDSMDDAIL